ncbi:MAG TPA: hypothetical protein VKY74_13635, partial [Chloroflexia bacterium]|nr:hypothetical protein [Chloroflexia bacterium]
MPGIRIVAGSPRPRVRALRLVVAGLVLGGALLRPALPAAPVAAAPAAAPLDGFADPAIAAVWARADSAVATGAAARSWLWGPGPFYTTYEPMDGTPTGTHLVQYFDKGRLEVNDPGADRRAPWFVTGGLLVKELVLGQISTSMTGGAGESRPPATAPVAGDAGPDAAPAYPACRALLLAPPPGDRTGAAATLALVADGTPTVLPAPPAPAALGSYEPRTRHNIADVFWRYLQAGGAGPAANWVYVLGLPLTEPFWVRARVGGGARDVLVQLFERRTLTYTPGNSAPWQVEMGNVGRHYYAWRYADLASDSKTPATRTRYDIAVQVNGDRSVAVREQIHYTNTTAAHTPLPELVLRTIYHHWPGAFVGGPAHAGGQGTSTRWRDNVNLALALPTPLAYGAAVDVDLTFTIHPPAFGGRHGYDAAHDLLTLGDWLPSVVPYENGGWSQFPYGEHGDQGNNEVADYRVSFQAAGPLVVGGTGVASVHAGGHWVFDAPGVRDVAYTLSPNLLNP